MTEQLEEKLEFDETEYRLHSTHLKKELHKSNREDLLGFVMDYFKRKVKADYYSVFVNEDDSEKETLQNGQKKDDEFIKNNLTDRNIIERSIEAVIDESSEEDKVDPVKLGRVVLYRYPSNLLKDEGFIDAMMIDLGMIVAANYHKSNSLQDPVTGISNRRAFYKDMAKTVKNVNNSYKKGHPKKLSIVYFDMNNFKPVNDNLGHHEGDRVLKTFAEILEDEGKLGAASARLGGR